MREKKTPFWCYCFFRIRFLWNNCHEIICPLDQTEKCFKVLINNINYKHQPKRTKIDWKTINTFLPCEPTKWRSNLKYNLREFNKKISLNCWWMSSSCSSALALITAIVFFSKELNVFTSWHLKAIWRSWLSILILKALNGIKILSQNQNGVEHWEGKRSSFNIFLCRSRFLCLLRSTARFLWFLRVFFRLILISEKSTR